MAKKKSKKSPYRRKRKVYVVAFEEGEYAGLEVELYGLSVLDYLKVASSHVQGDGHEGAAVVIDAVSKSLKSWNLVDEDDEPVPARKESVQEQDFDFVAKLADAWIRAMGGVDEDLGKESPSGDPALEASLKMESL